MDNNAANDAFMQSFDNALKLATRLSGLRGFVAVIMGQGAENDDMAEWERRAALLARMLELTQAAAEEFLDEDGNA